MAVTRRGYIFGAFLSGLVSVLLIVISIASDSWVVSSATTPGQVNDSSITYGIFTGEIVLRHLGTPSSHNLYITCVPEVNACAVSCKTTVLARQAEVRALAAGLRPNPTCGPLTTVVPGTPLNPPPVISFAFYVCLLLVVFLQLVTAVIAAGLAIVNATKNPTEPILGLPGCLWANVVTSLLGSAVLLMFGVYWAVSGLRDHLAMAYIALGDFTARPALGYSYWLFIASIIFSLVNVALIEVRKYLLERDPPPPTLKVENHSDGTIFLY